MSAEEPTRALGVHLRRTDENVAEIEALSRQYGGAVGVAGVLDDLDHRAVMSRVPGRAVEWGFSWDAADVADERWWPQGITTSADAWGANTGDDADGDAEDAQALRDRRVLMVSWYSQVAGDANEGSRVSVIDLHTLGYRHVLLVLPEVGADGRIRLRPLRVHAGGLVWCGPYLHVAGTAHGMFTCHVDDIVRVPGTRETFGYRYVLPVRFAYDGRASRGTEKLRYSFLSLDRSSTPPQLLAGEYGTGTMTRRLVRYPLDASTYHLSADEHGTSVPIWYDDRGMSNMQGAAVVRGTYYVTSSRGRFRLGSLFVGEPGRFREIHGALPVGPEDISYWPSMDLLWSVCEYPGRRFVYAIRRGRFDPGGL